MAAGFVTLAMLVLAQGLTDAAGFAHSQIANRINRVAGQNTHNPLERIMAEASTIQIDPRIKLAVNSTVLQKTGQWFMVSWSGVPSPGFDDWIALMVPAGADPSQTGPAKYKIAALSNTHITQGKGSLTYVTLTLTHIRSAITDISTQSRLLILTYTMSYTAFRMGVGRHACLCSH